MVCLDDQSLPCSQHSKTWVELNYLKNPIAIQQDEVWRKEVFPQCIGILLFRKGFGLKLHAFGFSLIHQGTANKHYQCTPSMNTSSSRCRCFNMLHPADCTVPSEQSNEHSFDGKLSGMILAIQSRTGIAKLFKKKELKHLESRFAAP